MVEVVVEVAGERGRERERERRSHHWSVTAGRCWWASCPRAGGLRSEEGTAALPSWRTPWRWRRSLRTSRWSKPRRRGRCLTRRSDTNARPVEFLNLDIDTFGKPLIQFSLWVNNYEANITSFDLFHEHWVNCHWLSHFKNLSIRIKLDS